MAAAVLKTRTVVEHLAQSDSVDLREVQRELKSLRKERDQLNKEKAEELKEINDQIQEVEDRIDFLEKVEIVIETVIDQAKDVDDDD